MRLEFHPEAEEEFLEAISYYEAQVPELGARFDREVRTAAARLLEYPDLGAPLDAGRRKLVLDRFPYYLIYAQSPETIQVLAVAHERRRPGYWEDRI